jgi:predicted small lipoprotein YifL
VNAVRRLAVSLLVLTLTGCGASAPLKPPSGKAMPEARYGREGQETADDLLKTTTQAAPERSVELRKRSEKRLQDPFDLPPSDDE